MPKVSWGSDVSKIAGTRQVELAEPELLAEALLNGGMTTDFDPADMPNNKSPFILNARVRRDKTLRRNGQSQFLDRKIDSREISAVIPFRIGSNTNYFVRVTDFDVQFITNSVLDSWTILAGNKISGRLTDHAVVLGELILADGIGRLQLADLDLATLADLGPNAPTAKYVTGFSERAVAANGGSSSSASETVYWSGNRNLPVWDTLEDISSGQKRLDTSPRVQVDPISGIFGFSSVMVVPRENSIWLATQNPVASDPFRFFRSVPGVGTNLPGSIAIGRELLMFIDSRMRDIVVYRPGQNIETIGLAVRNEMFRSFVDADSMFSAYLTSEQEYYVGFQIDGVVRIWCYNFITQAWTFDEVPDCTSLDVVDQFSPYTSFDDLTGTFDGLIDGTGMGTFDELSVTPIEIPTLVYGFGNGDITKEDPTLDDDRHEGAVEGTPIITPFTFELQSKEFKKPKDDITVTRIELEYQCTIDADMILQYSKNGGIEWTTAKVVLLKTGPVQIFKFKKQLRARRLMWRVTSTQGKFDLLGYELDVITDGESRN